MVTANQIKANQANALFSTGPTQMISLEHAKRSERLMRATTSLTVHEFDELAGRFALGWAAV